jgi:hypothetical protein
VEAGLGDRVHAAVLESGADGQGQLITQLVGLGIEKHDDLCDACVRLILGLVGDAIEEKKVHYV